MNEEEFVEKKEMIAALIFDHGDNTEDEDYVAPHEETCHVLAEEILNALGFFPIFDE